MQETVTVGDPGCRGSDPGAQVCGGGGQVPHTCRHQAGRGQQDFTRFVTNQLYWKNPICADGRALSGHSWRAGLQGVARGGVITLWPPRPSGSLTWMGTLPVTFPQPELLCFAREPLVQRAPLAPPLLAPLSVCPADLLSRGPACPLPLPQSGSLGPSCPYPAPQFLIERYLLWNLGATRRYGGCRLPWVEWRALVWGRCPPGA